jgi:hypothetical protein
MPDETSELEKIAIALSSPPNEVPDPKTREEEERLRLEAIKARLQSFKQDTEARDKYANRIFVLICVWLSAIFGLLVIDGFDVLGFQLETEVMITAITGTTLNVLGIFVIVARYLFPTKP